MLLSNPDLEARTGLTVRLAGLALVAWSIIGSDPAPATGGRGLVVLVLLIGLSLTWILWSVAVVDARIAAPWVRVTLGVGGGVLLAAAPHSGASAFPFVAVVGAGIFLPARGAAAILAATIVAYAAAAAVYDVDLGTVVAYAFGFLAAVLAARNRRQSQARAEQAELLLAQEQRSHEEALRAAALDERGRIAREIHDVLAHALAGLTIQLEATRALVEQGADRDVVLARVDRAHRLAREGLDETRRAVGALRGDAVPVDAVLRSLAAEHRAAGAAADVAVRGAAADLAPTIALAVVRTAQEALTNARKHAPGADVAVALDCPPDADDVRLVVTDSGAAAGDGAGAAAGRDLAATGGGYGLPGMRERAEILGGDLDAGPAPGGGWRVALRVPAAAR